MEEPPMTTRRRLGDRRNRARYEIVGQLWGSLETFEPLEVHNISRGGALVETRMPVTADSVQRLRLTAEERTLDLQARVAHVHQRQDVTAPDNHLVGVEFLGLSEPAVEYLEGLVRRSSKGGGAPEREA
jgi:hypothetical protein